MVRLADFKDQIDYSYSDENEELNYFGEDTLKLKQLGNEALKNIDKALDAIASAKGWGIFDIMGGGLFSSMLKHDRFDDAKHYIKKANKNLKEFSKLLNSSELKIDINLDNNGFLEFADIFLDNFIADFMVQNKMNDVKYKLEDAREKLVSILERI